MKSKYLTAAISVAPVPGFFLLKWAVNLSSDHHLIVALSVGLMSALMILCLLVLFSGEAYKAWREILGGDREER